MMNKHLILLILLWIAALIFTARSAFADDMWTKAGRGFGNLTTGYYEIVHQTVEMSEDNRWPIALFGGLVKGVAYGTARTLTGAFELVTFPIPGYEPIMYPEYIIGQAYHDTPRADFDEHHKTVTL
ncbi:MAG: exosortase system-associated protein, TIGR04073 family [Candidatus Omnitrophica bacterium]|nr:exosortase system-associated protein, TIGR04073 family [Candidatus Omnitrophota bacterium]